MLGVIKMCMGGKPPVDNSAELARKREAERNTKIATGRTAIDDQFSQFDDKFYSGVESDYNDYYQPQLTEQFDDARRKLILSLSSQSGGVNSSSGARRIGDLTELYNKNQALTGDRALSAANGVRGDVESNRNDLYSQNRAAADPSAAAAGALNQSGMLSQPRSYDPLGAVFSDFINSATMGVAAEQAGYRGLGTGMFNNKTGGSGSSQVIS
jgi:hypothetical protein